MKIELSWINWLPIGVFIVYRNRDRQLIAKKLFNLPLALPLARRVFRMP